MINHSVRSIGYGGVTVLAIVLLGACGVWIGREASLPSNSPTILLWQWLAVLLSMFVVSVLAGILANGRLAGVLIDERNRISLGRVQWLAWFLVLFSAYFTGAVWDVAFGDLPAVEANLFGLIGITTGSVMVSNIIVDGKKKDPTLSPSAVPPAPPPTAPMPAPPAAIAPPAIAAAATTNLIGKIDVNNLPADASFEDLYLGEEAANRQSVDPARLQKLIITVLLVTVYAEMLWAAFVEASETAHVFAMPVVGTNFLGMLGASHAAYLVSKASPKT